MSQFTTAAHCPNQGIGLSVTHVRNKFIFTIFDTETGLCTGQAGTTHVMK